MSPDAPDRKRGSAPRPTALNLACSLLLGSVLLPAASLCAAAAKPPPAAANTDLTKSEQELSAVRRRIDTLRGQLQHERSEKDDLSGALESAEKKLAEVGNELHRLHREIAAQNERIRATQVKSAEAQYRLDEERDSLAAQIRAAYLMGNRARTRLWLSQQDTARMGRVLTDYDYINRARAEQVAAIHAQLSEIAKLQATLLDERSRLESLELDQTHTLEALEKGRNERKSTLAQIEQRIASSEDELRQAQAEEQQVRKLLDSLREALADIPADLGPSNKPFAQQRGSMMWPLRGPVIAEYGSPKVGGKLTWTGRWIGGRDGTPVRAIARGRVAYVGWLARNGLIVILEHDGGYFTLYGHCSSVEPTVGEWVDAGQVIAAAGDTGGHDRSGVYLEIRKGSTALDPREWLGKTKP